MKKQNPTQNNTEKIITHKNRAYLQPFSLDNETTVKQETVSISKNHSSHFVRSIN